MEKTLDELREERLELDRRLNRLDADIKRAEKSALEKAKETVWRKIERMSDEDKDSLLNSLRHSLPDCDNNHPHNGYDYDSGRWRCRKCMLQEILNGEHGGRFDFRISVDIFEVTV